jgi:hypothetical protein
VSEPKPDVFGVDLYVCGTDELGDDYPLLAVQVKSWSRPRERDGYWRFDRLSEKQFNALAGNKRSVPRLLALVVVPRDVEGFASADEQLLRLSRAAYWMSLRDMQRFPDPTERKVTVDVPRRQLLTVQSLKWLCERSAMPEAATGLTRTT